MKRRVVALLMATMMGAFCITGCGSSKEATSDKAAKTEKEADTESKFMYRKETIRQTSSVPKRRKHGMH